MVGLIGEWGFLEILSHLMIYEVIYGSATNLATGALPKAKKICCKVIAKSPLDRIKIFMVILHTVFTLITHITLIMQL